jgi:hypothetical protein
MGTPGAAAGGSNRIRLGRAGGAYSAVVGCAPLVAMAAAGVAAAVREPPVARALALIALPSHQLALALLLILAALALGAGRGPVLADPFRLGLALAGPAPWQASLRRPLARNWTGLGAAGAAAGCLTGAMMALAGVADWAAGAAWALGWSGYCLAALAAWLVGQRWPALGRLAGLSLLAVLLAWSTWFAWPAPAPGPPAIGGTGSGWGLGAVLGAGLAAAGAAACWAAARLVDGLDPAVSRLQAERWADAGRAARSGRLSEAGVVYQARATRPARRPAGLGRRWWSRTIWLDCLGALRAPVHLATSTLALMLAGAWLSRALATAWAGSGGLGLAAAGGLAGGLAGAGVRGLAAGVRQAAEDAVAPSAYGVGTGRLLAARAVFPVALGGAGLGLGDLLNRLAGPAGQILPPVAVWALTWLATAVVMVCLNTLEQIGGSTPGALDLPMYSPMGDPAPVLRAAWQVRAQLAAALWGALLAGTAGLVAPELWLVLVAGAAIAQACACLRSLARQP